MNAPDPRDSPDPSQDLSWLAQRAADSLAESFNAVTRDAGLVDLRDWLVLALISDGGERTQGQIAAELSIDKTTLVALLDRLEAGGLINRSVSPRDRRARIPQITAKGLEVKATVAVAKEAAIDHRLSAIPAEDRAWFHMMLGRIVQGTNPDTSGGPRP
ncbi:MarR family transcriptional regulator [Leifsonia shinshuensis]|uniref:MarR family winged helix-turn-helix transcriptional regulator n=1 Tax=Leifsonia shinshuensis TaxID=150026 RepID=UPI00285DF3A4|nr:MarR family transcriptional regulator [Leifsonia shinshuensis]MDR6972903.1 DNA-binding MarR family transcriptional regulator [Leifsonia shinshuensis]